MERNVKIISIFSLIASLILSSNIALALGPASHIYVSDEYFKNNNQITEMCKYYRDEFNLGALLVDITIYDYMDEPDNYVGSHNWNFANTLWFEAEKIGTNQARCIAYGAMIGHLVTDTVSHNNIVPYYIRSWNLGNIPTHWIAEGDIEAYVADSYPQTKVDASKALELVRPISPRYNQRYVQMIEVALGNPDVDVPRRIEQLNTDINVFYQEAFSIDLGDFISKIGYIVPIQDSTIRQYLLDVENKMVEATANLNSLSQYEPHGFTQIRKAELEIINVDYKGLAMVSLLAVIVGLVVVFGGRR